MGIGDAAGASRDRERLVDELPLAPPSPRPGRVGPYHDVLAVEESKLPHAHHRPRGGDTVEACKGKGQLALDFVGAQILDEPPPLSVSDRQYLKIV